MSGFRDVAGLIRSLRYSGQARVGYRMAWWECPEAGYQ